MTGACTAVLLMYCSELDLILLKQTDDHLWGKLLYIFTTLYNINRQVI